MSTAARAVFVTPESDGYPELVRHGWLIMLLAILAGLSVPWFFGVVPLQLSPIAWSLFGFGLVSVAAGYWGDLRPRTGLSAVTVLLQALGILVLTGIWHLLGGIDRPDFLLAYFIPVALAVAAPHEWAAVLTALTGIASVTGLALAESVELRWQLVQLGLPFERLVDLPVLGASQSLSGARATPSETLAQLSLFAAVLLAGGLVVESLRGSFERSRRGVAAATDALLEQQSLSRSLVVRSAVPTALVKPGSLEVIEASESLVGEGGEGVAGAPVRWAEELELEEPEEIWGRFAGEVPQEVDIPFVGSRVAGRRRVVRLRSTALAETAEAPRLLQMIDVTDCVYRQLAVETLDTAVLVVDRQEGLQLFNRMARELAPELRLGDEGARVLRRLGMPADWLETQIERRSRVHVSGRDLEVRAVAAAVPGTSGTALVLHLGRSER